MLAKKYAITALTIALLVLIGFTMKDSKNTELSAVFSNVHTSGPVTAAPKQSVGQNSSSEVKPADTEVSRQSGEAAADKETAVEVAEPSVKSKADVSKSEPGSAPAKSSSGATPSAAASPMATSAPTAKANPAPEALVIGSDVQQTTPSSSMPTVNKNENNPIQDQAGDGEDPVPNVKKVNISTAEVAKVVEQFEQLADSDQNDLSWKRKADHLIVKGLGFLGTPYVFGSKTGQTDSFDCSSFMKFLYMSQGVSLPRDSRQQSQRGTIVPFDQLREGDLVFFTTPKRKDKSGIDHIGHVAVYLGNGLMLHTFRPGIGVTISELNSSWKERFVEAKHVL